MATIVNKMASKCHQGNHHHDNTHSGPVTATSAIG